MLKKAFFILQLLPLLLKAQSDLYPIQDYFGGGIGYSPMYITLDSIPGASMMSSLGLNTSNFDNPFIVPLAARDEIYAYGLRNMWRFSWDLETGFLWGADVGQYEYEEINIIQPGLNYGWNIMEGTSCYDSPSCDSEGLEPPIFEYELYVDGVCSITGGYVYRGSSLWSLSGKYVYGDWCTGDIWALTYSNDGDHTNEHLITSGINITSFGIDQNDELLICANSSI